MSKLTTGRAMAFERLLSEDAIMLPQYRKLGGRGIALAKALNRPFEFERTDTAYSKTLDFLPANWKGAAVESIGGKTVVWNQIVPQATFDSGSQWSVQNGTKSVSSGVMTMTPDGTGTYTQAVTPINLVSGHKFLSVCEIKQATAHTNIRLLGGASYNIALSVATTDWQVLAGIWDGTPYSYYMIRDITPAENRTATQIRLAYCVDLTLMFGSGNEPSTVAEFAAMFPTIDPAYNAGSLISAGVTSILSKDADSATLDTYAIPAEVQALLGYGWSAGSVYNYIDWQRKVYVQRVGSVDLGTLTWSYVSTGSIRFQTSISDLAGPGDNALPGNFTCAKYIADSWAKVVDQNATVGIATISTGVYMAIYNPAYTDAAAFKTAMSGVMLNYELAEPVETDISAYLTDDNLLAVEPGGTLTFENQLGNDYRIPVPTKVKYQRRGE